MAEPIKFYEPIADGSQALPHTAYDLRMLDEVADAVPNIQGLLDEGGLVEPLLRDVFFSLHRAAPDGEPLAPVRAPYLPNDRAVHEMMQTAQWRDLRDNGTTGDPLLAGVGAAVVARDLAASLPPEVQQQAEDLAAMEQDIQRLIDQAQAYADTATDPAVPDDLAQELQAQANQLQAQAEAMQQEAAPIQQDMAAQAEANADALRVTARKALDKAGEVVGAMQDAFSGFGAGYSRGASGTVDNRTVSMKEKIALANRMAKSDKLKKLAEMAGRMVITALETQRRRVDLQPEEVEKIALGNDFQHLLPAEMALMADPALNDLFLIKLMDRTLMQYQLIGKAPVGRGPIIVALDESGSMDGPKEIWAKAVCLGLLAVAQKQKRDFLIYHFSDGSDLKVQHFVNGQAALADTLTLAEHFFGGGTDYEPWMARAMKQVSDAAETNRLKKADVIIISDGQAAVDSPTRIAWALCRKETDMRVYSVLIGTNSGLDVLNSLSDQVIRIDDLKADRAVTDTLFSIGG